MGSFKPATRKRAKARIAFDGPAKSGKSRNALTTALALAYGLDFKGQYRDERGKVKVACIDSERGSLSKYKGERFGDLPAADFDVCDIEDYSPVSYMKKIEEAGDAGYEVVVIDSLSHAWQGEGGALDLKEQAVGKGKNDYTAWGSVTPLQNRMVDAILTAPCHVVVTLRTKTEYVLELNDKGKTVPRKIGLAPIQRAGIEYEFDICASITAEHSIIISGSRCSAIDDKVFFRPGPEWLAPVIEWLDSGEEAPRVERPKAEQLERIVDLQRKLKITDAAFADRLTSVYGVRSLNGLNVAQAVELEDKLAEGLARVVAANAAKAAAANGSAKSA